MSEETALDTLEQIQLANQRRELRHEHVAKLVRVWSVAVLLAILALFAGLSCTLGLFALIGAM